jgi:hypothetical protein
MKKILTICSIMLLIFYINSSAQQTEINYVDAEFTNCGMTDNFAFAFSGDGKISVYNRDFCKGNHFFSSTDNGKTWQKKSTVPLILENSLVNFAWGYNHFEYDTESKLNLVLKYKPGYDNFMTEYKMFNTTNGGDTWLAQKSFVTNSSLKWDQAAGNPVDKNEIVWCSQKIDENKSVMVSIGSVCYLAGPLTFSYSDDRGLSWVKNQVIAGGQPVISYNIRGLKFFSDKLGLLFLTEKYLLTSDGGMTWEEYGYPNNAKVQSADASDPQHIYISKGNDIGMFSVKSSTLENIFISNTEQVVKLQLRENMLHCLTSGGNYMKFSTGKFDENAASINLSVYPNPVTSQVTFSASDLSGKTISIINLEGKTVASKQGTGTSVTFDVQNLPAGIYFTEVQAVGEKPVSVKWMK